MTGTKRLSLHGRLRMAAACPDPDAALLAEAADAITTAQAEIEALKARQVNRSDAWEESATRHRIDYPATTLGAKQ